MYISIYLLYHIYGYFSTEEQKFKEIKATMLGFGGTAKAHKGHMNFCYHQKLVANAN